MAADAPAAVIAHGASIMPRTNAAIAETSVSSVSQNSLVFTPGLSAEICLPVVVGAGVFPGVIRAADLRIHAVLGEVGSLKNNKTAV